MSTITEQIHELEQENASLKELKKLFEKAVKMQYGIDAKKLKKIVENSTEISSDFEKKIVSYFGLKSAKDYEDFLAVFCTDSSLNYFTTKRGE